MDTGEGTVPVAWFMIVIWPPIMRRSVNTAPLEMVTTVRMKPGRGPNPAHITSFIGHTPAGISQAAAGAMSESSTRVSCALLRKTWR